MQQNNLDNLIINKMTQAQYDTITPNSDELYLITDGVLQSSDVINALGYTPVNKAGDTMTGSLLIDGAIYRKNGTFPTSTPSSNTNLIGYELYGNNTRLGLIGVQYATSGNTNTYIQHDRTINGTTYYSVIRAGIDDSGNAYATAPTPASTSNGTNIATTAFCDGNWIIPSSEISICSSQSINGSGTLNYSLSSVLPDDTNLYEMQLLCIGETGSTSGNRVQLILGNSNTYGSSKVHAFDVIARSAARVFANNTVLFLGHHADTLTVARNSAYTGTVTISCIAYRKVR